jgi:dihydropteroate synthase
MGILNVTPDSFADGGRYVRPESALRRGLELFDSGADIVDVGGESTRPRGSQPVSAEEEIRRVVPVIESLRSRSEGLISIDTSKSAVARAALDAGADVVNDVSGFGFDPDLPAVVAERGVPVVLMHLRGDFASMHERSEYEDVSGEVASELGTTIERAQARGVRREQVVVDPGLGFAKRASQSLAALRDLDRLSGLERPILVGPSRKSFIGAVLDRPVEERLMGTAAAVAAAVLGGAHIVRVHDVPEMRDVARLCDALLQGATS